MRNTPTRTEEISAWFRDNLKPGEAAEILNEAMARVKSAREAAKTIVNTQAIHGPYEEELKRVTVIIQQATAKYRTALADAIRRPMGVIPDSAEGLVTDAELRRAEERRSTGAWNTRSSLDSNTSPLDSSTDKALRMAAEALEAISSMFMSGNNFKVSMVRISHGDPLHTKIDDALTIIRSLRSSK